MTTRVEFEDQPHPAALVTVDHEVFMPALSIQQAVQRFNAVVEFVRTVMREGVDYGIIPGTDKHTLLKPGAEKLCTLFGLTSRFEIIRSVEDWTGEGHNGEPFFFYLYRCQLWRGDRVISEGDGSCNSWEQKYRYREAQRKCPACSQTAIIRGKEEFGGGWLCFRKRGGCGAKFDIEDAAITDQQAGRVMNENIADQVNTIQKMSQKRCLGGTTSMIFRTSRGIQRDELKNLYEIFNHGLETIYVPGVDGDWRKVEGMIEDRGREVYRIDLADGSYIRATAEHVFPRTNGTQCSVASLKPGDKLVRSPIRIDREIGALPELGWTVGFYLAEGYTSDKSSEVSFTLHQGETAFVKRIQQTASMLGSVAKIEEREGKTINVNVNGKSFRGLIDHFVAGKKSYHKHLSRYAWRQGDAFLHAILEGYLEGDGCWTESHGRKSYWRIGFTGENYELAEDLRAMCAVLGYRISLKRSSARLKEVEYPTFVGWVKKPVETYNQKDLNEVIAIAKESKLGTVYDMEVDGDHLFCLATGIQTHNSLIAATLLAVNGSEFFTQDNEEFMIEPDPSRNNGPAQNAPPRMKVAPGASSESRAGGEAGGHSFELSFIERIKQEQWRCTPAQKQMILNLLTQILSSGGSDDELCRALAADYGVVSPALLAPNAASRYISGLKRRLLSAPVEL
jgi:LAGLIDADG-like domain